MDIVGNELVVNNMRLAYDLAFKYYGKIQHIIELEELQSIAFLALVKASKSFNPNLQYAFSTYAYSCIRNELINYITTDINNKTQSLSTEINEDIELQDIISSDTDTEAQLIDKIYIQQLLDNINLLSNPYKEILVYKSKGYTFSQIAKIMNISKSKINECFHKGVNILRYRLKDWRDC